MASAEEMWNLAAQQRYGIGKTNIRWWKKQGAVVHNMEDDALWKDSDKELSGDDFGHPGPSDEW
jgi:hypothetical protein